VTVPAWIRAVGAGRHPAPTIHVLGGFLSSPFYYAAFARRLRARGAAQVVVSPVWTQDWLLASRIGLGRIITRHGRALLAASAASQASSHGAPVLAIGHSAGGIAARLLTSPEPFEGRRLNASGRIGAIVTLGSPHLVSSDGNLGHRVGTEAADFANRFVPGAWFAPRIGYLTVGSTAVPGRADGSAWERRVWGVYQSLVADPGAREIAGDGLIPARSALLPGVPSIVLDDARHGSWPGPWYGSDAQLDRWWPEALATWHRALDARVALLES
jgi:hypothetical protein